MEYEKIPAFALLSLLLLCGLAFPIEWPWKMGSPFSVDQFASNSAVLACEKPIEGWAGNWFVLSIIALLIGFAAAGVGQVLTGVLSTEKQTAWVKGLLWSCAEGAVLLMILSASIVGLGAFGEKNIDTARTYSTLIKNTAVFDFGLILTTSTIFSFFAKQSPHFPIFKSPNRPMVYIQFQMGPMFRAGFDALNMLSQLMIAALAEWTAHEYLLCFIKYSLLTFVLPAGIFLRSFGIKGGGNALIGIAIALYFIYPWLMVVTGELVAKNIEIDNIGTPAAASDRCPGKAICCIGNGEPKTMDELFVPNGPFAYFNSETLALPDRISQEAVLEGDPMLSWKQTNIVNKKPMCVFNTSFSKIFNSVMNIFNKIGGFGALVILSSFGFAASILEFFNLSWVSTVMIPLFLSLTIQATYEVVFFLFVVSLIMPIFMIFVTITFAKEIAGALGTQIDLSALEKII